MKTLHILTKAELPENLVHLSDVGDGLILLAEGCYQVLQPEFNRLPGITQYYAVDDDLAVRGLVNTHSEIQTVGYPELVKLVLKYERSMTW